MKFTLAKTYRFWWPVEVRMPDPDNPGRVVKQTLKIQFEPKPRDEVIAAQEHYDTLNTARERADHEREQLLAVVKNWDDVVDEDGGAIAFSAEAFDQALQTSWFRTAVYAAYADCLNGNEVRLGN